MRKVIVIIFCIILVLTLGIYIFGNVSKEDNTANTEDSQTTQPVINDVNVEEIRHKIKDENLIAETGGIVQGMSGSPIIQNEKVIGAVTHVFVNDPTRGFGISIDQMLGQ